MLRIFNKSTRRAKKSAEAFVRSRYPAYKLGRSVFRAQDGTKSVIAVFLSEHGVHDIKVRVFSKKEFDAAVRANERHFTKRGRQCLT